MAYSRFLLVALLVGGIAFVPSASASCVAMGMVCQDDTNGDGETDTYWVGKFGYEACVNLDEYQTHYHGSCGADIPATDTHVDYGFWHGDPDDQTLVQVMVNGVPQIFGGYVNVIVKNQDPSDPTPEQVFAATAWFIVGAGVDCEDSPIFANQPADCQVMTPLG